MNKTINFCGNCPFYHTEYDEYAITNPNRSICCLADYLKIETDTEFTFGRDNDVNDDSVNLETPEWCPLKKEDYYLTFNHFSDTRENEIKSTSDKIEVLQKYFDDNEDFESLEYINKNNELKELYKKMSELMSNEESDIIDDFQEDMNKSLDEIKKQMLSIETATTELQDVLNNFG